MKKIINNGRILATGLLSMCLASVGCEDILDKEPVSRLTYEDFGPSLVTTAAQAESFLNYVEFEGIYFNMDRFCVTEVQTDNCYGGGTTPSFFEIDEYRIATTNANILRDWRDLYVGVSRSNRILDNILQVKDTLLTETRRKEMLGEASFIRAFFYFELVRIFGDLPIMHHSMMQYYDDVYMSRSPESEVYDLILADLEVARLNVKKAKQPKREQITNGIVHAMLAHVYATIEPHDWTKVKAHCDSVIAGGYTLLPSYNTLWGTAENQAESIFEIQVETTNTGPAQFYVANAAPGGTVNVGAKKNYIPSQDLVQAFDAEGDMIRKNATLKYVNATDRWTDEKWDVANIPVMNKYRNGTGQNYIIYRLAEILLLKAEALNELHDVPGAAALVNQVRARVSLPVTTATTEDQMRAAIEKERRLELAFEGFRWFDLERTGRTIEVMNASKDGHGALLYNIKSVNQLLWPIPQEEIDRVVKVEQNDGYK